MSRPSYTKYGQDRRQSSALQEFVLDFRYDAFVSKAARLKGNLISNFSLSVKIRVRIGEMSEPIFK